MKIDKGVIRREWHRKIHQKEKKDKMEGDLSKGHLEINTSEAFEMLFQKPLAIVLSDTLGSH